MSIKGMQASLKGVQLLQGGAVETSAPLKATTANTARCLLHIMSSYLSEVR